MDKEQHNSSPEAVSERRRRLLKGAAAGAPVIATLQSGAALANTSAYQCLLEAQSNPPDTVTTQADGWVRKNATRTLWYADDGSGNTVWVYTIDGQEFTETDADGDGLGDPWTGAGYTASGDPTEVNQPVQVLVYYEYPPDGTDATEVGPYPKFLATYTPPSGNDTTPITGTCLCSISPNEPQCV